MKVTCLKSYYDTKLQKKMTVGDIIEDVTEKRARELSAAGVGKIIEEIETTKLEDKEVKKETAKLVNTKAKKTIRKK